MKPNRPRHIQCLRDSLQIVDFGRKYIGLFVKVQYAGTTFTVCQHTTLSWQLKYWPVQISNPICHAILGQFNIVNTFTFWLWLKRGCLPIPQTVHSQTAGISSIFLSSCFGLFFLLWKTTTSPVSFIKHSFSKLKSMNSVTHDSPSSPPPSSLGYNYLSPNQNQRIKYSKMYNSFKTIHISLLKSCQYILVPIITEIISLSLSAGNLFLLLKNSLLHSSRSRRFFER